MPVSRFNRLSSALAGSAPTPLRSPDGCPALVPTERIVESERVVKDEAEIATLREAGRRLGRCDGRGDVARAAWPVGDRGRRRPRRDAAPGRVRAARRSRRSSPRGRTAPCRTRVPVRRCCRRAMEWCWTLAGSTTDTAWILPERFSLAMRVRIFAVCSRPSPRLSRRPSRRSGRESRRARSTPRRARRSADTDWKRRSGTAPGTGSGSRCTRSRRIGRPLAGQPDLVLQPGMVFTIEPGVYVEGVGGVRIEDDVLVTDDGVLSVLTAQRRVIGFRRHRADSGADASSTTCRSSSWSGRD